MKIAIIGSRDFNDYDLMCKKLKPFNISLIISGHAKGADTLAERYANENDIPTKIFPPDWKRYGKSAGMIRNTDIIENAELVIAFWDTISSGTKDSIRKADKLNKKVIIININK